MPSNRSWKVATFSLGTLSFLLFGVVVAQSTGRLDPLASVTRSGSAGFAASDTPASVRVGDFRGEAPLTAALRDIVTKRLGAAAPPSYRSPGVTGLIVGGSVADKVTPGSGATPTTIEVKVSLFITKEPSNSLLSILSSSAALTAGGTPTPAELDSYKMQATTAAAGAVYDDFLTVLR